MSESNTNSSEPASSNFWSYCPGGAKSIQALRAQLKKDWNKAYRGEKGKNPSQGLEPATSFVN